MPVEIPLSEIERCEALPFRLPIKLRNILDGFKWACLEKNTSAVMIIDGKSGRGKTTLSGQIGAYCDSDYLDKKLNLMKIHWNPETFINGEYQNGILTKIGLKQAKKGDVIIFDEAMLVSNRSTMSELNRMIVIAMSMIRSKNIIVIFNVNSFFDLDKNISIFRSEILLHVYGDSLTDRGKFMAFFQAEDGQDRLKDLYVLGKKFYDYSKPHSNFNTNFPKWFAFDEEQYEIGKQEGINQFLSGKGREKTRSQVSRDLYIKWIKENTKLTAVEVADIGRISDQTVYRALSQ